MPQPAARLRPRCSPMARVVGIKTERFARIFRAHLKRGASHFTRSRRPESLFGGLPGRPPVITDHPFTRSGSIAFLDQVGPASRCSKVFFATPPPGCRASFRLTRHSFSQKHEAAENHLPQPLRQTTGRLDLRAPTEYPLRALTAGIVAGRWSQGRRNRWVTDPNGPRRLKREGCRPHEARPR